ncbi:hypothetical protein HETIRDRAFT_414361 [Heterobasidion irregulare TC 32-1]|uniref:Uncharacterized protein n=1 Tax=Heterobasidion irregulare (strain TC 32-1) TaxID=747525 RepID=W4KHL8_HETIT|nr:uncharacterized protein HETIRDRAFT_414361 [Heterobasidion irregulare TC 32-1]ETW85327.1 hypothetical protein HETIRDRAFT_414361 [Heterobasidion irregulare TC 32-1]
MSVVNRWPQSHIGDPQVYKASSFSPLSVHHSPFLPTTSITLVLSHALRYLLSSPRSPSSVQVIRHDRPRHDVKFIAGTIAFKHDSKFNSYVVSSGDTALGSVALVCGIGLYRSLEVASTSGCCCVLLALRCLLWSLCVLTSLCSLIAVSFFLLALACSLCLTWSLLSPSLAVALLLVSGFSSQSLLVYLSLVSLLVNLLCPFFMLGGPSLSLRPSRSLLLLSLSCLFPFSGISGRPSQLILGHEYLVSVAHRHTRLLITARDRVAS